MLRKRTHVGILALAFAAMLLFCVVFGGQQAYAQTAEEREEEAVEEVDVDNEIESRMYAIISLSIGGSNGEVWAEVRNDFTLGFATILVYVELYSSASYQESYTNMRLENRNFISDLNIFQTIGISAPTGGVQRYWMARTRYRINSGDWTEKVTNAWLFDGDGNVLNK